MTKPERLNRIEQDAIHGIREYFSDSRKVTLCVEEENREYIEELAKAAIFPEKPSISYVSSEIGNRMSDCILYAKDFFGIKKAARFVTCGGVDDGKSTFIGRVIYDTKSKVEQEEIKKTPIYLRTDGTVDFALLAGCSEEEAKQGITVQVSYSTFSYGEYKFLMADVPGHEEYTYNMAYAAKEAEAAVVMIAANKGIVPQTKRHVRICHFMGICNMVFAVNKMDLVSYNQKMFREIEKEIASMMQEYPDCCWKVVPVAAKEGENIAKKSVKMSWYKGGTLLEEICPVEKCKDSKKQDFCMQVQRICKSSQIQGAEIKKRIIQGKILSGEIQIGDEIYIYPTGERAYVTGIYGIEMSVKAAECGCPVGIEIDRELDVARGYVLTKEDFLSFGDRIEVDILWTADTRLTQGTRFEIQSGSRKSTVVVTKLCYQIDVNTGEHKYAEYLGKNGLARCELAFSKPFVVTCLDENSSLGAFCLMDRKNHALCGYGNVMRMISEDAWKEEGAEITRSEREVALGQRAGLIFFEKKDDMSQWMNYVERYLLRMGFHTMQTVLTACDGREIDRIRQMLETGLILLVPVSDMEKQGLESLLDASRIYDCGKEGQVPRKIKQWASKLIE